MSLTLPQARRLVLTRQGLSGKDSFGRGVNGVMKAILNLRYVQIDTISVVDRAHHHVLRSRVSNYLPKHLDKLLQDRKVFEYWHHAAAYLPMEDYRFYLPMMKGFGQTRSIDKKYRKLVLDRIRAEGPLMSKDFEHPKGKKSNGWWDWKPTKLAMEQLFLSGELMVSSRQGFQKKFDLTERVLPSQIDCSVPTEDERAKFYVDKILDSQGVGRAQDIAYMKTVVSSWERKKLVPMVRSKLLEEHEAGNVISLDLKAKDPYYVKRSDFESLPKRLGKNRLIPLSPFDNIIINRDKLSQLFNFDYLLECYVPAPKRQYGYFTLPLLLGDRIIGRMDCKAHRKTSLLVVNNIWLEPNPPKDHIDYFESMLTSYASDLGCEKIQILQAENQTLQQHLKQVF